MVGLADSLMNYASFFGDFARPAKLLADAAAIDPNGQYVLSETGFMLLAQNRCAEAISVYRRVLDEYPRTAFRLA
jgi:cytochrome c-type biogenesis protein CcmH/NrfG